MYQYCVALLSVSVTLQDHRHPAVVSGRVLVETSEYVPVTLPCTPSHPAVAVRIHRFRWFRWFILQ